MEEMPTPNLPVQRLKVAILPLDLPCSGPVTHSGEILANGKSHGKKPNTIRVIKSGRMRWAGHVARMGEKRGAYRVLVGKPEGNKSLGRYRRRWKDNIKMDPQGQR